LRPQASTHTRPSLPAVPRPQLPKSSKYLDEARVSSPEKAAVWSQKLEDLLADPNIPRLKAALSFAWELYTGVKLAYARGFLFEDFIGLMLAQLLDGGAETLSLETWRQTSVETDGLTFRFDHVVRAAEAPRQPRVVIECKTWLDGNWLLSTLCKFHLLKPGHPRCRFYLVSLADESADCGRGSRRNMTRRLLANQSLMAWTDGVYFVDERDGTRLSEFLADVRSSLRAGTSG
jgi:hypothetical protein